MQRAYSLKRRGQFQYVYRRGQRASCKELSLLCAKSGRVLVGFSVGKKVGGAVMRNLLKRRMRELVRPLLPRLRSGLYVIIIKEPAVGASFIELRASLVGLLNRQRSFLDIRAAGQPRSAAPPKSTGQAR
ncbi:hypothetical protein AGMMS49992_01480 [Clostridia bacterium]|nr:hypothetical protein AGMMS49992_01480 [Clostridia bacterium]